MPACDLLVGIGAGETPNPPTTTRLSIISIWQRGAISILRLGSRVAEAAIGLNRFAVVL
jgi:hypothetical protein